MTFEFGTCFESPFIWRLINILPHFSSSSFHSFFLCLHSWYIGSTFFPMIPELSQHNELKKSILPPVVWNATLIYCRSSLCRCLSALSANCSWQLVAWRSCAGVISEPSVKEGPLLEREIRSKGACSSPPWSAFWFDPMKMGWAFFRDIVQPSCPLMVGGPSVCSSHEPMVLLFSEISPPSIFHFCSPLLPLTPVHFRPSLLRTIFWAPSYMFVSVSSCCQTNHQNLSCLKQHTIVISKNYYFCGPGVPAQLS